MNLIPQDPSVWASKLLALKNAIPFQAFCVVMVDGRTHPVSRPEYIEITDTGACAKLSGPDDGWCMLALEWVVDVEVGGEIGAPPRPPRYAAKLRVLQEHGPKGPLVITMQDGEIYPLAGPHQYLLGPDGRNVADCHRDGLVILETSEIADLAPAT
jgi:hypothetical protein